MYIVFVEFWVVPIAIAAVACYMRSTQGEHRVRWLAAAIGLATLCALMREHMIYLLAAGAVAALAVNKRREAAAWFAGMGVFVVAFAAHYAVASQHVAPGNSIAAGVGDWFRGGPAWLWATLTFAEDSSRSPCAARASRVACAARRVAVARPGKASVPALRRDRAVRRFLFFANPQPNATSLVGY